MRSIHHALALAGALIVMEGGARAQTTPAPTPEPEGTPTEPPENMPPGADDSRPPPADEPPSSSATDLVPGAAIGIGTGYFLPTDITIPNAASVRLRTASGLTFEALVRLSFDHTSNDTSITGGGDTEDIAKETDLILAVLLRKPAATRGKWQFVWVGGGGVAYVTQTDDPDGPDNATTTSSVQAFLNWGVGIDWFFRHNWSISLTAVNPLFSVTRNSTDNDFMTTTQTSYEIGAIWDPTIQAMLHIYY